MEIQNQIVASGANTTTAFGWVMIACLGMGLAASSGLNTFLPLLMLSIAAKYSLFGIHLGGSYEWLVSDAALGVLALATFFEVIADKIPAVDHFLDTFGIIARPTAGTLAAASVIPGLDPVLATMLGLVIGAPVALSFHAVKAGTRTMSTATTLGMGNPILSMLEDAFAFFLVIVSFLLPILAPIAVVAAGLILWRLVKKVQGWSERGNETLKEPNGTL